MKIPQFVAIFRKNFVFLYIQSNTAVMKTFKQWSFIQCLSATKFTENLLRRKFLQV
jgi:hypothetical protein